jgi:hypothetical protein
MSPEGDISESGRGHRFGVTAAVVAATLTLVTAIIGLINVVADGSGSSGRNPSGEISTTLEPQESENDKGERDGSQGSGSQLDPSHDGNSRATAKRLEANQLIEASLIAPNDVDWYVYRVPKSETATVKFVKGDGDGFDQVRVTFWEGLKEIEWAAVGNSESYAMPRIVSPGARLFVSVEDRCAAEAGEGVSCGVGPYSVIVRTGPPG